MLKLYFPLNLVVLYFPMNEYLNNYCKINDNFLIFRRDNHKTLIWPTVQINSKIGVINRKDIQIIIIADIGLKSKMLSLPE